MQRTFIFAAVLLLATHESVGQDAPVSEQNKEAFELLKSFYRNEAARYDFSLDKEGKQKLTLQPPVMTWTGEDYQASHDTVAPNSGEVYIWTYEGRAVVAGGVGSFPLATGRDVFHEFHAFTEQPPQPVPIHLRPTFVWSPQGEKPRPIPDAPRLVSERSAALTQRLRLTQMRKLAQEFSGGTIKPDGTGKARLRLLLTPVYRLDADELAKGKHNVVDGAVFVFTGEVGTDPEMLLLIECRKTADGLQWTYVPAAMTYLEMWMEHKDKEVWHIPPFHADQREHNYITVIVGRYATLDDMKATIEPAKTPSK